MKRTLSPLLPMLLLALFMAFGCDKSSSGPSHEANVVLDGNLHTDYFSPDGDLVGAEVYGQVKNTGDAIATNVVVTVAMQFTTGTVYDTSIIDTLQIDQSRQFSSYFMISVYPATSPTATIEWD